jgi:hypothetical protein
LRQVGELLLEAKAIAPEYNPSGAILEKAFTREPRARAAAAMAQ